MIDIAVIWAFIIAFAVFVYVVMDGFDLGIGLLFPLFPRKEDRDVIMNSVAPGLGRQRDLAGARRRGADGCVSAGLCGSDARFIHAHNRDAAGPRVSRRSLRVSLAYHA
jgi:hypothetical protein